MTKHSSKDSLPHLCSGDENATYSLRATTWENNSHHPQLVLGSQETGAGVHTRSPRPELFVTLLL